MHTLCNNLKSKSKEEERIYKNKTPKTLFIILSINQLIQRYSQNNMQ
jgi:hypothetical protein